MEMHLFHRRIRQLQGENGQKCGMPDAARKAPGAKAYRGRRQNGSNMAAA